ncbi:DivIVA domain-containing protein [Fructobacillus sp. M1-13]|uniref:DivIVA domain-containing protein n=1 Tax=Fructobacillus papyriferae TaxID=2713171 RepID=A0ABS5QN58_9LACO|nr:DivIVA domain-containing protein [Fructobacillus papyriferae]MBS9334510.1 DivIVA domain-containing protein [Fructobacillus papyriferae]MCD2158499.1 DivIVA domain-containing protein [Fructobacillus papyriferae]
MALTPDEILNHEFTRKGSRAYVAREVDSFLDEVNNDYRSLIADFEQLKKQSEQQQERIDELEAQKDQVNESIMFAQSAASRLRSETEEEVKSQLEKAQTEAQDIVSEARTKAENESKRLAQENTDLIDEQNRLRERVASFKDSFIDMLDKQKSLLQDDELAEAVQLLPESMMSEQVLSEASKEEADEPIDLPNDLDNIPDFAKGPIDKSKAEGQASKTNENAEKPADPTVVVFPESEED